MKTLFERLLDAGVLTQDELERYKNLNELAKNRDVVLDRFSMEFSNEITARIDAFLERNPIGSELLASGDEEYTSYCFDRLPGLLEGFEKVNAGFDLILQDLLASRQRLEQGQVEIVVSQEVEQGQAEAVAVTQVMPNYQSGCPDCGSLVKCPDCANQVVKPVYRFRATLQVSPNLRIAPNWKVHKAKILMWHFRHGFPHYIESEQLISSRNLINSCYKNGVVNGHSIN